jgi:hypothetical protein
VAIPRTRAPRSSPPLADPSSPPPLGAGTKSATPAARRIASASNGPPARRSPPRLATLDQDPRQHRSLPGTASLSRVADVASVQAALVSIDDMSSTRINTVYRFERVSGSEMVYAPRSCRSSISKAS